MEQFVLHVLLGISSLLGVQAHPPADPDWRIVSEWKAQDGFYHFKAERSGEGFCGRPQDHIILPKVIHGVHEIIVDGNRVFSSGDGTFNKASPFYSSPTVSCSLVEGRVVEWHVVSYTAYFARLANFPKVRSYSGIHKFGYESSYPLIAGALLFIAIFGLSIFYKNPIAPSGEVLSLSSLLFCGYVIFCSNSDLHIDVSMIAAHRIADMFLWIGTTGFWIYFYHNKMISKFAMGLQVTLVSIATPFILFGSNGDVIQLGTTIPFISSGVCLVELVYNSGRILSSFNRSILLESSVFVPSLIMLASATFDILNILGILSTPMTFHIGVAVMILGTSLKANSAIRETYRERDDLVNRLEERVAEKTESLSAAMNKLQLAQAELVQSAKLASLGTLSAGIAHEINNSINYVNGALVPIERMVKNSLKEEKDIQKADRLLGVMKDGLNLTVDIIKSLRTYTGLNQAKFKETSFAEVFKSVLTILNSKVRDRIEVQLEADEDAVVFGSTVGLNQVVMNLVSNAIDAMPSGGKLKLMAKRHGETVRVEIADSGTGMPKEIQERIFEPFYTTKDVGRGTGLGLYIVKKEVERHGGRLKVQSEVGKGTTFVLELPIKGNEDREEVAA